MLLALLFMLLLTLLATTAVSIGRLETQMAANYQFREIGFQQTRALALAVSARSSHFPLASKVGDRLCPLTVSHRPLGCRWPLLSVQEALLESPQDAILHYYVERVGPELTDALPLRLMESEVSSLVAFDAARFEVVAEYDGAAQRLARAGVVEGLARRVPVSWQ